MSTDAKHNHDHAPQADTPQDPAAFWESHYGDEQVWSGNVNAALADAVEHIIPGSVLDLGCGEGADVLWLAQRGWRAVGVDISQAAIVRARAAAEAADLGEDRAAFVRADLTTLADRDRNASLTGPFDLVTASFFQSPVALDRQQVLRAAADLVVAGGHLLITSHAAPPPWTAEHTEHAGDTTDHHTTDHHADHHSGPAEFPSPEDELSALALDPHEWETLTAGIRTRDVQAPDGAHAHLDDSVVLVRRRGIPAADVR
ncbi:class I SAM-dependent methyltransferase [Brevibacterium jeotgali]|uniref:Methyltransferase domain-containing protein n=1 Tax=Brevibacterium jeotgali TaxID=1262550 RepID=A0A2H1L7H9_9MICO|nr:class I SAM-dependent methyltransferase [Brevibacterium jeotgali]TWC03432.1 methyltransferase family protein [Brevibacterium jeotgali]SMY12861.1 Methyltransferase domain-containing protein [Brevibacterium jeotgali]